MKRWLRTIFILMVFFFTAPQNALAAQLLVPGGQLVGLELTNDTVTVAISDKNVGIDIQRIGDVSERVVERFLKKANLLSYAILPICKRHICLMTRR